MQVKGGHLLPWMCAHLAFALQVTSTASTTTCWGCLNMEASRQRATTCSWGTMWTGGSSPWRPSVSSWPTKSNIQRTSSCWGEITSAHPSIEYMVSMMSVSASLFYLLISYFRDHAGQLLAHVSVVVLTFCRCWRIYLFFLFQVKEGTTSNSGRRSQIVSTASPLPPLLMRRSFAAMEVRC